MGPVRRMKAPDTAISVTVMEENFLSPGADLLGLGPRNLGPRDPQRPQDLPGEDGELMQRRIPKGRMEESIRSTHRNAVSSRSR